MREPYNGPEWPTHRVFVHPFEVRGPMRVEVVEYDAEDHDIGRTLKWCACPEEARDYVRRLRLGEFVI